MQLVYSVIVSDEDADTGRGHSPGACPVALALRRLLPPGDLRVHRHHITFTWVDGLGRHRMVADLPAALAGWLRHFDRGVLPWMPSPCEIVFRDCGIAAASEAAVVRLPAATRPVTQQRAG